MFASRSNLGLPRRVVVYYLFFSAVAVAWLFVGVLVVAHTVLRAKSVSFSLAKLGKLTAAIEVDYLRSGQENFPALVQKVKAESGLQFCAIVSPEGQFVAHTNSQLVGQRSTAPGNDAEQARGLLPNALGNNVRVFRLPLEAKGIPFGTLWIGVAAPSVWNTLASVAPIAPLAVLVPLGLVGVGAVVLSRVTMPLTAVSQQLQAVATLAPVDPVQLEGIKTSDAISLGWNRVVDLITNLQSQVGRLSPEERLQQALAMRSSNLHSEILHSMAEGVAAYDAEGKLTFVNEAVSILLGEELSSKTTVDELLALLDGESRTQLDPHTSARPTTCEAHPTGHSANRILRVSRAPLGSERQGGHLLCLRDVTQQKLAEKMRDQFIDTATHELRTPLSNIKAYAETLVTCEEIDVEEQKEFCNVINNEVTRLARFVDDLLSISSMEMGSIVIEKQKVETERLFAEVLEKVDPLMEKKQITFHCDLPEKIPELKLDKDKFVAVLVNLLGNAAKYTPVGGSVTLRVRLEDGMLEFGVEDTGVGIAPDELPKVFDKFFRSADPRVQEETGTGLGLSLAQEVVRMHGGEITVESELDHGTTFIVSIPMEGNA